MPLPQRHLRLSLNGPYTEYTWKKPIKCGPFGAFKCYELETLIDFDFNKPEDRLKFNQMGFDCSVRKRPE